MSYSLSGYVGVLNSNADLMLGTQFSTYTHTYIHTDIHTYVYVHIYIHTYIYIYVYTYLIYWYKSKITDALAHGTQRSWRAWTSMSLLEAPRYSIYLLYWYKSTKNDAAGQG